MTTGATRGISTLGRWALVAIAVVALASCEGDSAEREVADDTTTTTSSTSSTAGASPRDWDEVRFDFGDTLDVEQEGSDLVIEFDRYQTYGSNGTDGLESAPDYMEEPILYGNTGVEWVNDNPKTRRYTMAPDGEIMILANGSDLCKTVDEYSARWGVVPTDRFLRNRMWEQFGQDSVTFDRRGFVTRLRLSEGC